VPITSAFYPVRMSPGTAISRQSTCYEILINEGLPTEIIILEMFNT
jgi:hypothetical protein